MDSSQERSEHATGKKLRDARERGEVARSRDLAVAGASVVATIALGRFGERLFWGLADRVRQDLGHFGDAPLRPVVEGDLGALVISGGLLIGNLVGPIAIATMVAGVAVHGFQGGWLFTTETLTINWGKLNPATNLKKLLPSQSGIDTVKTFVSVGVIAWLAWRTVSALIEQGVALAWVTPQASALIGWQQVESLLWRVAWALGALAIADYGLQYYRFMTSMKMTKQEVKEEHLNQEGRPEVKGRIRRIQREIARRRMLSDVKRATVVITNPTHFAVALEYRRGAMAAPLVLAKGADHLAFAIRERAREHGIPIVENKPLAQALYKTADIGQFIPGELFTAVAELLAQLIRLRQLAL
ncbi:MAG: EscU/YscU/HrcU family type III secretion system export apparatus switch protein [Vicinamibacterales bacterium]